MKRRKLIRYLQASLLAVMGIGLTSKFHNSSAQTGESLTITWLGHTCFLFEGGGTKVLVNPFRQIGCTAGYRDPKVDTDLILISSKLLEFTFLRLGITCQITSKSEERLVCTNQRY